MTEDGSYELHFSARTSGETIDAVPRAKFLGTKTSLFANE
jgi:hypothetical protein